MWCSKCNYFSHGDPWSDRELFRDQKAKMKEQRIGKEILRTSHIRGGGGWVHTVVWLMPKLSIGHVTLTLRTDTEQVSFDVSPRVLTKTKTSFRPFTFGSYGQHVHNVIIFPLFTFGSYSRSPFHIWLMWSQCPRTLFFALSHLVHMIIMFKVFIFRPFTIRSSSYDHHVQGRYFFAFSHLANKVNMFKVVIQHCVSMPLLHIIYVHGRIRVKGRS